MGVVVVCRVLLLVRPVAFRASTAYALCEVRANFALCFRGVRWCVRMRETTSLAIRAVSLLKLVARSEV
jgi:hypothetical protein